MAESGKMKPEAVRELFRGNDDIQMKRYELDGSGGQQAVYLAYCEGMVHANQINRFILPGLSELLPITNGGLELDKKWDLQKIEQLEEIVYLLFSGQLIIVIEGVDAAFAMDIASIPQRQPQESSAEMSIKGPRDAFTEELATNVALVRKRLRSNSLRCERFVIGERSKTDVALLFIEDIAKPEMIEEARRRLKTIKTDVLLGASPLEELLSDNKYSLFPLLSYTTRPDFVADSLIRGRFAVIAQGAPTAVLAPGNLFYMLRSPEDSYFSYLPSTFGLLFRYLGLVAALLLPGFYIAVTSYNVEQIPFPLLATIGLSRMGLPFPGPLEAFLMVIMFEIFREAGERLPKAVGSTVAVVGGIVVGEAAIRAGLTSTTMIVVAAMTGVANFTVVNQTLVFAVSISRLFIMICSSFLGMYGFMLGLIGTLLYLATLKSYGLPYLAPLSPVTWQDLKFVLARIPWIKKNKRPKMLQTIDDTRQEEGGS
ncbi:spore germination protein [Paenibacillus soyae]|uniref:Spore germination protein n=1 Tax=Paenibacillus soyae TaxID=2969249 RepID=A0A9X2S8V0_9BACL|nr:spore germination protein [Paenibacillus soyae]MCR2804471.1 spore germination protein [Paenibacillus soyae]